MGQDRDLKESQSTLEWRSAVNGDREAMASLLRQYQDQIYRLCLFQLGDSNQAIEATQETAMRIISGLGQFQGRSRLSTWILGIARNVCREQRRKSKKWTQSDNEEVLVDQSKPDPLVEKEESAQLRTAINKLPDRQREAIVFRYFESMSITEIASIMKITEGTVKATISFAMGKLKTQMRELDL